MEVILNTSVKPFNFSFFVKGGLKTVQVLPGASRVKAEYIPELRKLRMFATLEDDGVLAVGIKAPKDTVDATEIAKKPEVVEPVVAHEVTKPLKAQKETTKASKKAKSKTLDLEDL